MFKPPFVIIIICFACLFVEACSKKEAQSSADQAKKSNPLEQTQLQVSPSLASPNPNDSDLQQAAESLHVTKDQVTVLLQHEKTLWNEFQSTLHSPDHASQVVPFLLKTAKPLDSKEIIDAHAVGQVNGKQLPTSFLEMLGYGSSAIAGIPGTQGNSSGVESPGFMGIALENQPEQHVLNAGVIELAKYRPDLLASFASERASVTPPTAADCIVFRSVIDGVAESPFLEQASTVSQEQHTLPHGSELTSLAKAPNPIYRLLALKVEKSSEPDRGKLIQFYSSYARETDTTIQLVAINALKKVGGADVPNILQNFENLAQQRGNTEVEHAARQARTDLGSK